MAIRILTAAVAGLAVLALCLPARAVGEFASGNWKGSAYFTGPRFTHCAMSAGYDAGWRLVFTLQKDGDVVLGLSHPSLSFRTGSTTSVTMQLDGGPAIEREFLAVTPQLINTTFAPTHDWFQRLRKGRELKARFGQTTRTFSLRGANDALAGLFNCAAKYRSA